MKPERLEIVKIAPLKIGKFSVSNLEIDLMHVNYGLDPKTKSFRKKSRSNFEALEVVRIFQLLDGIIAEPMSFNNSYAYFSFEVYPIWLNHWFRLIFCVEYKNPKTAGVITLYKIKKK